MYTLRINQQYIMGIEGLEPTSANATNWGFYIKLYSIIIYNFIKKNLIFEYFPYTSKIDFW